MRLTIKYSVNKELKEKALREKLEDLDRALLNSTLSYAVYTKNASWFESWAKRRQENPGVYFPSDEFVRKNENFNKDRLYDRVFAALIAQKFTPANLDLKDIDAHKSELYTYDFDSKYKNGIYKSLDNLAAATAMTSKNGDGTNTLHVSFRGTDTKAQPFLKFLLKAYPDMAAYYDSCKPFEEAVLKYASDPKNRISKIDVSGHSLGGAMVQHFFKSPEVKNLGIPVKGFTYGSPPAVANAIYAMLPALRHLVIKGNFKNMGATALSIMRLDFLHKEKSITQYQHVGDIVPKLGNMLMQKTGAEIITLRDSVSKMDQADYLLTNHNEIKIPKSIHKKKPNNKFEAFMQMAETVSQTCFKKPIRFIVRMSQTVYHDMARYTVNLDAEISKLRIDNPRFVANPKIEFRSLCPTSHTFGVACSSMRLQYQASVKMMGFQPDFNQAFDAGSRMEPMDFSKLMKLRNKALKTEGHEGPMSYKKI